jgi:hypothetical protein
VYTALVLLAEIGDITRSAGELRAAGVRAVVVLDPDALPAHDRPSELACALDALGAAAVALGDRFGLQHASPWARVTVLTRGRLPTLSPPASALPGSCLPADGHHRHGLRLARWPAQGRVGNMAGTSARCHLVAGAALWTMCGS